MFWQEAHYAAFVADCATSLRVRQCPKLREIRVLKHFVSLCAVGGAHTVRELASLRGPVAELHHHLSKLLALARPLGYLACMADVDAINRIEANKPHVPDEVADAIRTLIRWTGEDPSREGLLDTPNRVARAWLEYCQGYQEDPSAYLSRTFEEVGGYDELVLLKDIPFQSHCEHHMAPIVGKASIAYMPKSRVVGISKLARVLHGYARRLQVQERLTAEVAKCIWDNLHPHGVAVVIEAQHGCMTGRGVRTPGVGMTTSRLLGCFLDDPRSRKEVLSLMGY
jgi:GTP cyclohydrolase IA